MFSPTSRYANLEVADYTTSDGKVIVYKRRRFAPRPESQEKLLEIKIEEGDRIDRIASETIGDPEQFWRIVEANHVIHPSEITERADRKVVIPVPRP